MGYIDYDFVLRGTTERDRDLFLGPILPDQNTVEFSNNDGLKIAHFMMQAGIFPSVGQARKNGWNRPVPSGFSHFIVGKNKSSIAILNILETNP